MNPGAVSFGMNYWKTFALGAIDGLIYVGAARSVRFYLDYRERTAVQEGISRVTGEHYVNVAQYAQNWVGVTFLIVAIFIIAAYSVHRIWNESRNHPITFWLVVGITAITTWNLFALAVSLGEGASGPSLLGEGITSIQNPLFGLLSFGLVLVVNLAYGAMVSILSAKRQ
jgi:hypothetical protein